MARGPTNQVNKLNSLGQGQLDQSGALEKQLIPDYTSMLSEGYSPEEKAGMTTAGMGALQSSFDSAAQGARNSAARTNNPASLAENEDELAREGGVASGNEAAGLQKSFADARLANEKYGLAGLSGLEEGNQRAGTSLYGMTPSLFNVKRGAMGTFDNGLANMGVGAMGGAIGSL